MASGQAVESEAAQLGEAEARRFALNTVALWLEDGANPSADAAEHHAASLGEAQAKREAEERHLDGVQAEAFIRAYSEACRRVCRDIVTAEEDGERYSSVNAIRGFVNNLALGRDASARKPGDSMEKEAVYERAKRSAAEQAKLLRLITSLMSTAPWLFETVYREQYVASAYD